MLLHKNVKYGKIMKIEIDTFEKEDGTCPFEDWFQQLDGSIRSRLEMRFERIKVTAHLGYVKQLDEIFQMKFTFGGGIRVYFGLKNNKFILLLAGGNKSSQVKDIKKAKAFWESYHDKKI